MAKSTDTQARRRTAPGKRPRRKAVLAKSVEMEKERVEHERMVLVGADRDAFITASRHPPQPAERLVKAFARHRALFG
jgi:hypothetical protein